MNRERLASVSANVLIPFIMGASLGLLFMLALYLLDVGGMRSLLIKTGATLLDVGLIPVALAFGALAIGTKELLIDD
jgi:hypothetical protein